MKVQGTGVQTTATTAYAINEEKQEIQTVWKQENEWGQPIEVTISEEGMESLRQKVMQTKGYSTQTFDERMRISEISSKSVMDLQSIFSMEMINATRKAKSEDTESNAEETTKDKYYKTAYNYLDYYANKYDEIVKGYEDGTREFWISDENSELGFRQVTKEDELEALDKAYERNVEIQATFAVMEPIGKKAIHDSLEQLNKVRKDKQDISEYVEEEPIEKLYERMMESRNQFKNRYSSVGTGTQEERNQNLTKLIDEIFKSQFSW
jgi:hypothetical protein